MFDPITALIKYIDLIDDISRSEHSRSKFIYYPNIGGRKLIKLNFNFSVFELKFCKLVADRKSVV